MYNLNIFKEDSLMSYEHFKAQLILDYIKDSGCYPNDKVLAEIKKLADFAYLGE